MDLKFFDASMFLGRETKRKTYKPALSADEIISVMDVYGIEKALVWHVSQKIYSVPEGNRILGRLVADNDRLYGCWVLLPPQTQEIPSSNELFCGMKSEGIYALRVFPGDHHNFLMNRQSFGSLMDEVSQRHIPVMVSIENRIRDYEMIYGIMKDYPQLTLIICDTGAWGQDRLHLPLLEGYENVYVETSFISCQDGIIKSVVKKYGSRRLLHGSGFPVREPLSAMLSLMHEDIDRQAKEDIAYNNMQRIIDGVIL